MNFKWYLISKVIIWFITLKVNANQQCTLRMSYRRVDPFSKDLINIFIKNTQIASLGNSFFFYYLTRVNIQIPLGQREITLMTLKDIVNIRATAIVYNQLYFLWTMAYEPNLSACCNYKPCHFLNFHHVGHPGNKIGCQCFNKNPIFLFLENCKIY